MKKKASPKVSADLNAGPSALQTVAYVLASGTILAFSTWLFPILMAPYFTGYFVKNVLARSPFLASAISVLLPARLAAPVAAPAFLIAGLIIRFGSRYTSYGPEQSAHIVGTLAAAVVWAPLLSVILIPLRSAQISKRGIQDRVYELGVATGVVGLIQILVREYSHVILSFYSKLSPAIVRTPWHILPILTCLTSPMLLHWSDDKAKRVSASITILALISLMVSHPSSNYLSSVQSNSGLIVIAETGHADAGTFRYMRCDHSLLGGLWVGPLRAEMKRRYGEDYQIDVDILTGHSESIYSAFYVQEAITFLQGSGDKDKSESNALVIGLGAGIVPTTLVKQDHPVSIIEIDPEVYKAAVKYFGLPASKLENIWLDDARHVMPEQSIRGKKWDWIIHDVFTGGSVPGSLFTLECWDEAKRIMSDDAIIAINFAGRVTDEAGASILRTIFHSFEQCRAYTDQPNPETSPDDAEHDFINMAVFCTMSGSENALDLLEPTQAQLRTPMRESVLTKLSANEVSVPKILGWEKVNGKWEGKGELLEDKSVGGKMDLWQREGIANHWAIMRKVLDANVWYGV